MTNALVKKTNPDISIVLKNEKTKVDDSILTNLTNQGWAHREPNELTRFVTTD